MINKMKKDQGKMVDESLKVDNFGNFYYEVKKGGRIKKFPDLPILNLSDDADILRQQ